ncbi:winged-helix domain-containing protein [Candidatus Nanohalovita haloferacivicina]|uniref:winged-helix domain-containing protein n=1 Tax=Candidatus Nanohalovita haloferacivicina TaxID=2978046 RepID=UPI00325F9ED7
MESWKPEQSGKKTVDQAILEIADFESWKSPKEMYREYRYYKKDPVHVQTFSKYLNELESIGELEARGRGSSREYRKADKPVQETREDHSSPLSEGLPDFVEKRIQKEVEKRVQEEIDNIRNDIEQRILIERKQNSESQEESNAPEDKDDPINPPEYIHQLLTEAEEELSASKIGEKYRERTEYNPAQRTIRRYLKNLVDRGLVEKEGSKKGTTYKA